MKKAPRISMSRQAKTWVAVSTFMVLLAVLLVHFREKPQTKPISRANIRQYPVTPIKTDDQTGAQIPVDPPVGSVGVAAVAQPPIEGPLWLSRPASEWQGMRIDLSATPYCEQSALCGLARACVNNVCTACGGDFDCASGEACVMDHCLLQSLVECRLTKDCTAGSTCIMSGYSEGPRGNADMRSLCVDPRGGASTKPIVPEPPKDTRTSLPNDDLLSKAREAAGR